MKAKEVTRQKCEGQPVTEQSQSSAPLPARERKRSAQTSQIIEACNPDLDLFCTPLGEPHATINFGSHTKTYPMGGSVFREYLNYKYFNLTKTAPQTSAIHQAVLHFSAVARFESPTESTFIRVASAGDRKYLDLANDRWQAVRFDAEGWHVVRMPDVRFRRSKSMRPLPTPTRGGDINQLREFLNIPTDGEWLLFVTNLVSAIFPHGPYPILGIHGEAGSGKTTMARVFRKMVDPNASPSRATPRDARDLMVSAINGWALCFDNLSLLPVWLSDCLCRLSTGGGFNTRGLYTDREEVVFDAQRPIILNGIEELATGTDLIDRSVLLELPVIRRFKAEDAFWKEFDTAHPQLLGAL